MPTPNSPEFTPALACVALALLVALQLATPSKTPLPADTGLAPRRARSLVAAPIPAYPLLARDDVFSPTRSGGRGGDEAASIDDCSAVGIVAVGRASAALIKSPGAPARLVRPGEAACGWRLSQIEGNTVAFVHDGQQRRLAVGQGPLSVSHSNAQSPQGAETVQ